jgi:hypothetical protein
MHSSLNLAFSGEVFLERTLAGGEKRDFRASLVQAFPDHGVGRSLTHAPQDLEDVFDLDFLGLGMDEPQDCTGRQLLGHEYLPCYWTLFSIGGSFPDLEVFSLFPILCGLLFTVLPFLPQPIRAALGSLSFTFSEEFIRTK